ncbi:hypothetical protein RJ639_021640, partial [Escallonia herrerae]
MSDRRKRRRPDPDSDSESDTRPFKHLLKPDATILSSLRTLASSAAASSSKTLTLSDLRLSAACREVSDLPPSAVQSAIESLAVSLARSILSGQGFSFTVPSRSSANQLYVPELDRIVLKDKTSLRPYSSVSTVRKTTITTRILHLIHQLCLKNIHVTKRDLFYTDVKLFQDQTQSDAVLDDVSCILGCTRSSLNVVAAEKGVIPEQCRLPMTEQDIKTGKDLLEEDFVKKNPGWVEELNLMVKSKQKAEIQALSSFGFQRKRRRPDPDSDSESDTRPFKHLLKPDATILSSLRTLASSAAASSSKTLTLSDLRLSAACREVSDLPPSAVQSAIESLAVSLARSILSGQGFSFTVPSRSSANQLYVPELDRIVLKDKTSLRPYSSVSTVRKTTITTRILHLIHQLCLKNIHVTKRDLFYTDVKLFQDQTQSDAVLDDVSCILGCTRSSLNVVAAEKGVVVGRLIFSDN